MSEETSRVTLTWTEAMRFEARTDQGAAISIDGEGRLSPSPMQLLLQSLGGCAGIDVVEILRKGRHRVESLEVEVSGRRRSEAPRRYEAVELVFSVAGDVPRAAAERAVELSLDRYCSVYHSLDGELEVDAEVRLEES